MTYRARQDDMMPIILGHCESQTAQQDAKSRGWLGGFHSSAIDSNWVTELNIDGRAGFVSFVAADFSGTSLSAGGQAKAALVHANQSSIVGVDIVAADVSGDTDTIAAVMFEVGNVPVYWKDTAAAGNGHHRWSYEWFRMKNTQSTTNKSFDFDPETNSIKALVDFYSANVNRAYVVYGQAMGTPMTNAAQPGGTDLILPGKEEMFYCWQYANRHWCSAYIMDGWLDYDGTDWGTKIDAANSIAIAHWEHIKNVWEQAKVPSTTGGKLWENENSVGSYPRLNVGIVS